MKVVVMNARKVRMIANLDCPFSKPSCKVKILSITDQKDGLFVCLLCPPQQLPVSHKQTVYIQLLWLDT